MKKLLVIIIACLLGVGRFFASDYYFQKLASDNLALIKSASITGFVKDIIKQSPAETKLILSSEDWSGNIYVSARNLPILQVGQKIMIENTKLTPWSKLEPGGFKNYLLLKEVWAQAENGQVKIINEAKKDWNYYTFQLHDVFNDYLLRSFSSDVSGVLAGVLFGDTKLLSEEVKNDFRVSGLSHVMAISGANMTMIAQVLFQLFFFVSLRKRIALCIVILVLFAAFVGAAAAVMRALIMAIIVLISLWFNLPYLASRALWVVCFLVYMWNPYILLYDIGFQLSVVATLGLLTGVKPINALLHWIPWNIVKETVAITLSATIFTMPISLYYFGSMSFVAPIINILLVPLLASLSIMGYLVITISLFPIIGNPVLLIAEYTLGALLFVINYLSSFAQLTLLEVVLPLWLVVLWLGIIMKVFHFLNKKLS